MKKILYIIAISIVIPLYGFTQDENSAEQQLASRHRPGVGWFYSGYTPSDEGKPDKYDRILLDLVYNDWHGDRDLFSSPIGSIGVNALFMFDFILTKQNTVSFAVGLGYSHYSNKTKVSFLRDYDKKTTNIVDFTEGNEPKQSKFGSNYVEIPIEFRFRTKGYQHFKFMVGGKIGYNFNAFNKEVKKVNGKRYTVKESNFPDLNPFRYGVTARIGIRNWAIYGAYYFSPIFKSANSVELYPFSLGISISLF